MRKFITLLFLLSIIFGSTIVNADSYVVHTVQKGDTYWNISQRYNTNLSYIQEINSHLEDILYEGNLLIVQPFNPSISIKVDNKTVKTEIDPYLENSRTFVPIRFVSEALGVNNITWNPTSKTVIIKDKNQNISLKIGSNNAIINGKVIKLDAPANIFKDRTFVPVRFIAEAFECNVSWDNNNHSVVIDSTLTKEDEDLYWLSRIVEAESKGEPYEGKLAVANVVLNRKYSSEFPNTIKEVVFDNKYGVKYQFTPAKNGTIYNTPSPESIKAAKEALEGKNNIEECLYFLNPDKAKSFWIVKNRDFYKSIERHDFYV